MNDWISMMVTKAQIKFVNSLSVKRTRKEAGVFVAEGARCVEDLLASQADVKELFAVATWLAAATIPPTTQVWEVTERELTSMSDLTTANQVIALVAIPMHQFDVADLKGKLVLGLDDIQDPGNLGSILRLCDWFGIDDVIASRGTVDCHNAKVVQATMGSIARVRVHSRDDFTQTVAAIEATRKPIYATTLDGDDIYRATLPRDALVLVGNESAGLSADVLALCSHRVRIPSFNANANKAESLNAAIATGIVCSEFRRRALS